ncbi:MAG: SDR family NAD(P)-dependent oxidoreductase [Candidatus Omnitrophica bacterium]|nr:SDR family NAD(P)-dependent oxidoreductase [Candidatus Omnitrophota bacterium]
MKRVLITGVAGMIGSHLADELLNRGYAVTGIDNLNVGTRKNIASSLKNSSFKFIKCDITDPASLKKAASKTEIIVHMAASKKIGESGDALKTLKINCEGTRNVFDCAKAIGAKVVFASTSDVYGSSGDIPFREDGRLVIGSPTAKRWAYAVSKIYGEQLAFACYKEDNVPIVVLRYFGAFSSRSSFTWSGGHIPVFIDAVLNDREIVIHGDGKQTRSMAYVDDVVNGTVLALESRKAVGEIFNIGNDEEVSVIDTARLIQRVCGKKKIKIRFVPQSKVFGDYEEIKRRVPDLSKAKLFLGYAPKVSFEEGLRLVIKTHKHRT